MIRRVFTRKRQSVLRSTSSLLIIMSTCSAPFASEVTSAPVRCATPITVIETKNHKTGEKWQTAIQPFCPREYLLETSPTLPAMNRKIVEVLLTYPQNGQHNYFWPRKGEVAYDGATTHVYYANMLVMKGEPQGRTFCCGLTLEVLYRVLSGLAVQPKRFGELGPDKFKEFWFCRELYAPGPTEALQSLGIGRSIPADEALPGDFVQIWRHNKTGHSVIFVAWAFSPDGKRVGMHYWSTQEGTKGIGFACEAIGDSPPMIWLEKTGFARLDSVEKWAK